MANIPYNRGIGRLATDRFDFQSHLEGVIGFRHTADQVDLNPSPMNIYGPATTVEQALQNLVNFIAFELANGTGFIAVGDGYDTYHNSFASPGVPGSTPYDASVPPLDPVLNDLFTNPSNPSYHRVRDGGIVFIKAGTYSISNTVNVPPGIILMGEGFGTKLINQTSSNAPMFSISSDSSRVGDNGIIAGGGSDSLFIFSKDTVFLNLTIADNFIEPKFLGDTSYLVPRNTSVSFPLVVQDQSSNLVCDGVRFLGKVVYTAGKPSSNTGAAIGTDSINFTTGTGLFIRNSSFDGFTIPIIFQAGGGNADYFYCNKNKIRCYGNSANGYGTSAVAAPFQLNVCNINATENYFYTNFVDNSVLLTGPVIASFPNTVPSITGPKANIVISNNNILSVSSSGGTPTSINIIVWQTSPSTSTLINNTNCIVYGNNDMTGTFNVNQVPNNVSSSGVDIANVSILGPLYFANSATNIVSTGSPYSITLDVVVLVNASAPYQVNLPAVSTRGRVITIKDISGNAATNPITVHRFGTNNIEGLPTDYVLSADYQTVRLISDGSTGWWSI
jgi:hypothetical protein